MGSEIKYLLNVPDDVASLVRKLHPDIKAYVRVALQAILDDPYRGKALKDELDGLRSYRIKRFKIIYRISASDKILEVITIGPRKDIYEETFRIISREAFHKEEHDG